MIFSESAPYPELWDEHHAIFHDTLTTRLFLNSSSNTSHWLNPEARMTLFSILMESKAKNIRISYIHRSLTAEHIAVYNAATCAPTTLPPWITEPRLLPYDPFEPDIRFVQVLKGLDVFHYLDKWYSDMEHVSSSLRHSKKHQIRVYQENNKIYIVTSKPKPETIYKAIALIPKFFPAIECNAELSKILIAFATKSYTEWLQTYTAWFKSKDFVALRLTHDLTELLNSRNKQFLQNWEHDFRRIDTQITEHNVALQRLYNTRQNLLRTKQGFLLAPALDITELPQYIIKNAYITDYSVVHDSLHLTFVTPLQYYDIDALKSYYRREDSVVTRNPFISRLFQDIFIKRRFTMFCATAIRLNFFDVRVVIDELSGPASKLFPHPHIMLHYCLGNNEPVINRLFTEHDYISAIEQIVAATKNINFTDVTVVENFIKKILHYTSHHIACYKYQDEHKLLTILDIEKLYAQEDKEDSNETN